MKTIKMSEIQLADKVTSEISAGTGFEGCVVIKITDKTVTLFRPYATTADFSYTGGVIPYIGIEQYEVERNSDIKWTLWSRKELR